jgi:DNA uptake protein ComE-like DNA-binding protein
MKMKRMLIALVALLVLVLPSGAGFAADKCVDVEEASAKELQALKGVGEVIAKRIVDYRKQERTAATKAKKGKWLFKNWATLMKVDGVGPKICADNLAAVCFSGKVQKSCPK